MKELSSFFILFSLLLAINPTIFAQNDFQAIVQDSTTKDPLIGANVYLKNTTQGSVSGLDGLVEIKDVPDGSHIVVFSSVGYQKKEI